MTERTLAVGAGRQEAFRADDESFRAAFPDLYGRARAVARRVLRDQYLADEVAQETMTRAYKRWAKVATHPNPVAWVLDVAWKVSMETARRRDRPLPRLWRTSSAVAPDESYLSRPSLIDSLRRLTERQRLVFLARYLFLHDVATTGHLLGMSAQQVKDASREARSRLHTVLEGHEEELLA